MDSYNEAIIKGVLSNIQTQIVISLLLKQNDHRLLKKYRPISLSNTDYKIHAFTFSNRLQSVIAKLIAPEHMAYMRECYIGQNIRLLLDILEYTSKEKQWNCVIFGL